MIDDVTRCRALVAGTTLYINRVQAAIKAYEHVKDRCGPLWAALAAELVLCPETLAHDAKMAGFNVLMAEKFKGRTPLAVLERKMEAKP